LKRALPTDKRREFIKDFRLAPASMHPIFRELAGVIQTINVSYGSS